MSLTGKTLEGPLRYGLETSPSNLACVSLLFQHTSLAAWLVALLSDNVEPVRALPWGYPDLKMLVLFTVFFLHFPAV